MTDRATFLAALRDRMREAAVEPRIPLVPVDGVPLPVFVGRPSGVDDFVTAWQALGGHVQRVARDDDVAAAVARAVDGRGPVAIGADPLVRHLDADLQWPDCGLEALGGAAVGVVGGVAAVAATGSIVVDAASGAGRSVSLLPDVAVFVIREDSIVDTPSDVLRAHRQRWPEGPPSQVVLVSGPSRSADIEMTLTVGVHGPGEVHAIIVA